MELQDQLQVIQDESETASTVNLYNNQGEAPPDDAKGRTNETGTGAGDGARDCTQGGIIGTEGQ